MTDEPTNPTSTTEELETSPMHDETVEIDALPIEETRFGKIRPTSIKKEMEKSYLDYAMSVIVSRALPDVRDGLKPVHRRILYSMSKSGIHYNSSYKKSARIVGDVLGKYHPHGDSPVYMALVRLAQDFSMRYPLIDGQGNFGSIDGDSPAAMRYTEARMAKIARELLTDIDKDTVPFVDNFDGSLQEPTVLPGKLPNLLLMGAEGIAVGMATKIPPHNLTEVCQAILASIESGEAIPLEDAPTITIPTKSAKKGSPSADKPSDLIVDNAATIELLTTTPAETLIGAFETQTTIDDIMQHINGPDFPTGGIMYDFKEISEGYRTGRGKVLIRAKAKIIEDGKNHQIIVTELPYQVNKARLIMKIAQLVRDKKLNGIRDLRDDSDRTGMQITIDLKRDARPKVVLNKLFKYTELQTSFSMNMVALNGQGVPQLMNIKQILTEYLTHRRLIVARRSQNELLEAQHRAHILEGLLIALANLDDVIETIRRSPDTDTAKTALVKKFKLSEIQAQAILDMQLKRLAALERQKIEDEYQAVQVKITALIVLLSDPAKIIAVVREETQALITEYGDERQTKLIKGKVGEFSEADLIPNEAAVITLTESGYIKRMSPSALRSQSRGGKGASGLKMKTEDMVLDLVSVETHDTLLTFTDMGRVFKLKAFEIPEASRQAKGTAMVNLINLKADESVLTILKIDEKADKDKFITLATKQGLVKKTPVELFENIRQNGIISITLNDGDSVVQGRLTTGDDELLLVTKLGKSIRFDEGQVKSSNRDTKGVKGITLQKNDYVVSFEVLSPSDTTKDAEKKVQLVVITENGLGKRTVLSQYPAQKRAGIGVKVADITKKTGLVAAARKINTNLHDEVVLSTKEGQTIKFELTKKSIPILTRPTQGVILMRPKKGDVVTAVAVTFKEE